MLGFILGGFVCLSTVFMVYGMFTIPYVDSFFDNELPCLIIVSFALFLIIATDSFSSYKQLYTQIPTIGERRKK